ncbi:helix-turn-helix domain-containing protein [Paenibacillus caui]|uniref:helix-turn-helix domain-containing protein n=1 Tax=Paenibacillus caui TaxID=2873927 RepID=UPI001CA92FF9|nr:AraC family transcriptional regulator [Paenibacillus caui]
MEDWEPELLFHVYVEGAKQFMKEYDKYTHWSCFIVDEGEFTFRMGSMIGKAIKGDMILCPPETTFYRDTSFLSFHFIGFDWSGGGPSSLEEIAEDGKIRLINTRRFNSTLALFRETDHSGSRTALQYKKHLLRDLWLLYVMENRRQPQTSLFSENPFLQRAVRLLEQKLEKGPAVKAVAREIGISQVQLFRIFKKEFQMTPSEYVHRIRMEKVQQFLVQTNLTLADIAERCGFTDEHHLSKSFKKAYGINPSVYRKSHML